jgi:N6-L-threonylcarbamoyladenine synthase
MTLPRILAFESSCDDTSVAILDTDYRVYCNITSAQPQHEAFGGVLPELASRLHMKNILRLTDAAFRHTGLQRHDISAVAVSVNPGLIGSLIVGLSFAKSFAWCIGKPLITVNHMLAHIFANFINHPDISCPFLAIVVSGGHTELVHFSSLTDFTIVGKTVDDAAGETFDKTAKLLGLGFPGGPVIDRLAQSGDPAFYRFPRGLDRKGNFNFSYSGLKTAVMTYLSQQNPDFVKQNLNSIAASVQQAIIDPIKRKAITYARREGIKDILIAGGVAANSALQSQLRMEAARYGIRVWHPEISLCMDNAAMVAAAAIPKFLAEEFAALDVNAFSTKGTKHI